MKIERIRKNHKKEIIIGTILFVVIGGVLTFKLTHSKYRTTQSINLATGTISLPNYKIMAMYKSEDGISYSTTTSMPDGNSYVINTSKSYCNQNGSNDTSAVLKTVDGVHIIETQLKADKCYLYFDRSDIEKPIISNVTTSVTKTEINVTVSASDNKGVTEYWYSIDNKAFIKGTGNTYKFSSLTAGSTHTIKVYVKDAVGNTSDTNIKSVTTIMPPASETILANVTVKSGTPDFSKIATTDEGVYQITDGMYGGTIYYWRGAVTNNYVIFAGYCWRIIRINGDKTIRLIYDGSTCHTNGTSTAESIAVASQAYNPSAYYSYYVGWTQNDTQRTNSTTATASNAKTQTESWYNIHIANNSTYAGKVADGKFCNDRDVGQLLSNWSEDWYVTTWSAKGTAFAYAGLKRLHESYSPTFSCPSGDVYTLKVGLVTADEVEFAGGKNENNTSYYLYNGQNYWTMSPANWGDGGPLAYVFLVISSGNLDWWNVGHDVPGLRPVINLKSDITFSSGNGTQNNPYIVAN